MKIDKVIFSTSELYSGFWNIQSRVWKEYLGIEPICILYGKKENTNMNEDYGKIIQRDFKKDLPEVLQITWSKFDYTKTEPDTTWIIGDIDMIPLQKFYFTENIESTPDDHYMHLNLGGIGSPRRENNQAFLEEGSQTHALDRGDLFNPGRGADLAGHYHVARGDIFTKVYNLDNEDLFEYIVHSHRYGFGAQNSSPKLEDVSSPEANDYYWCAEENYTSEMLYDRLHEGMVEFTGVCYDNANQRVDRGCHWDLENKKYNYNPYLLSTQRKIVDMHCARPYDIQEKSMYEVIDAAGILKT